MKRILLFLLPILILISFSFIIFGVIQIRSEQERQMDELKRKARSVAESIAVSLKNILVTQDTQSAYRLVQTFQNRERLQGCVIYDNEGKILAVTDRFRSWHDKQKDYIEKVLTLKQPRGSLEQFQDYNIYSYTFPILEDDENILGLIELLYDTSYISVILADLWQRISITLILVVIAFLILTFYLQRQIFIRPVEQLTEWFTRFQKGETDSGIPIQEKGELGQLASEVEQTALTLRIARKAMSDEAAKRVAEEDEWTEAKLRDLVRARLGENTIFVVSNREPYMHVTDPVLKKTRCVRPPSGVVTAIDPILRACGGTWIACADGDADKQFVNSKNKLGVPPEDHRYILKRLWLTKEEHQGYYYGFANEGLWPLCHITYTRPIFREADWQMYKKVNQKFADSILEELPAKTPPFIFIQDYHFTLLGRMIKEKRPDSIIALFWHIPWPNYEVFSICPYREEILDGMLACDLIGFHVQYHCNNFLETANRLLECRVDGEKFSVVRAGEEAHVQAFPISINGYFDAGEPKIEEVNKIREELNLDGKVVAVSVERIDYTKGIIERVLAIDRFLEKYPQYRGKFTFIQLAAPSRTHIKRYHDLIAEIDELVERTNWKYSNGNWKPIIYLKRHFSSEEILPYYQCGEICIVSSLHDGMNLVAKEYVAAKSDLKGCLLLSQFTGAARELTDAVIMNPYSIEEFADRIKYAIEIPMDEKQKRMKNMRKLIKENNIYRWAGNIITELTALKKKTYTNKL